MTGLVETLRAEAADRIEQLELLYNATLESFKLARGQDQARIKELEGIIAEIIDRVSEAHKAVFDGRKNAAENYLLDAIHASTRARAALKVEP